MQLRSSVPGRGMDLGPSDTDVAGGSNVLSLELRGSL
jgi:hypothetical protein